FLFGAQVLHIRRTRLNLDRYTLHHPQSVPLDADDLARIVRDQLDLVQSEVNENLRPYAVITQICLEPQLQVRLNSIAPLILQRIGLNLVAQTDAAAFLIQIEQNSAPFLLNHFHRLMELVSAVAPQRSQGVGSQATRVHTHKSRIASLHTPFHQRNVRDTVQFIFEFPRFKFAEHRRQSLTGHPTHKGFALHTVFDERLDRDHLQLVRFGEFRQLWNARHGAVFVHDFADDGGGSEPSQSRQIDGTFRLPRAFQYTAVLRL